MNVYDQLCTLFTPDPLAPCESTMKNSSSSFPSSFLNRVGGFFGDGSKAESARFRFGVLGGVFMLMVPRTCIVVILIANTSFEGPLFTLLV